MKIIELSKGAVAKIDDDDFEYVSQFKWWLSTTGYAHRTIWFGRDKTPKHRNVALHRELLGISDPAVLVDHKNGDKLDNRRSNLRLSNKSTNGCNRPKTRANTTGYKGVSRHGQSPGFIAQIRVNGKNIYLGFYKKPEEAALAYDRAAIHHFGEYAQINAVQSS